MTNARNRLIRRQLDALRAQRGGKCEVPGCEETEELEFAHVKPTELKGRSRGRKERYYDIIKNPTCYRLICKGHHTMMDELDIDIFKGVHDA